MTAVVRTAGRLAALAVIVAGATAAAQEGTGDLAIESKPPGAEIHIDGQRVGVAPVTKTGLSAGKHRVSATWPDGAKVTTHGKVVAGTVSTTKVRRPANPGEGIELPPPELSEAPPPPPPQPAAPPPAPPAAPPDPSPAPVVTPAAPPPPPQPAAPPPPPTQPVAAPPPPPPSGEAPGAAKVIETPILLKQHPQHRGQAGVTLATGVYCPNLEQPSIAYANWCSPRLRLGVEGLFSDFHIAFITGATLDVGAQLGFEFGTPYFSLGRQSRFALAIRTAVEGTVARLRVPVPGLPNGGLVAFGNSYGPNLSIGLGRYALEARLAVGWAATSFFNHDEIDKPIYSLLVEAWLGVRFQP